MFKSRFYFSVTLIMLLIAWLLQHAAVQNDQKVIAKAQIRLYDLESELKQSLRAIANLQTPEQFHEFLIHHGQQELGFSFFHFSKGKLQYWSDNETGLFPINVDSLKDGDILKLSNGIYEFFKISKDGNETAGLLSIRKQYSYENKYLVNEFNRQLGLYNAKPADNSETGMPLYSNTGKKIISVVLNQSVTESHKLTPQALLYLIGFIFFLFGCYLSSSVSWARSIGLILLVVIIRGVMIFFQLPEEIYHTDFFSPKYYASSIFFNSIGDFFLNSATFFCISGILYNRGKTIKAQSKSKSWFLFYFLAAVLIVIFCFLHRLIGGLILNSKITLSVNNLVEVDAKGIISLASIMLLLWGFALLVATLLSAFNTETFLTGKPVNKIRDQILNRFSNADKFFLLLLFTFYVSNTIVSFSNQREKENMKLVAQRLDIHPDHLAEYLFDETEKLISSDSVIIQTILAQKNVNEIVNKRLQQIYFKGYWNKFDISSWSFDKEGLTNDTGSLSLSYFKYQAEAHGVSTYSDKLFFLQNHSGKLRYLAILPLSAPDTTGQTTDTFQYVGTVVIQLEQKFIQPSEGFPELFVSNKATEKPTDFNYSFARYSDGSLIYVYGNYSYAFKPLGFNESTDEFSFVKLNGFNHLVYKPSLSELIIVSRPAESFMSSVSLFSYILLFFSFFYFFTAGFPKTVITLKQRIQFSVVALVIFSFLLIGIGTIFYLVRKYDIDQDKNILSRLNSLWFVINDNLHLENALSSAQINEQKNTLNQVANNLNLDYNLFDENGILFYSSQSKIFDKGIIGSLMNPEALFEMNENNRTQYVHPESIGRLKFTAAYAPFTDRNSKVIGYLNVPYFEKQNELKKEISGFLSSLINIYVFLLVLAIILALLIASRITQPLLLIQQRMKSIRLEKKNESIEWRRNDEIGALVKEYNRMVEELEVSAEKLARSERESAWREMAQQVAHEIKNPLTPMKLNIQHLQKAWNERRDNIDELFQRISSTLVEQINSLSNIATEFSNFAKMPRAKKEVVNLKSIITSVLNLFENIPGVRILYVDDELERKVFADPEQLNRVFSNIIKNSIQSIPNTRGGLIDISISSIDEIHTISITDNGTGIARELQSKIFTPSFTTKTSGMGLGLSITKNIVENIGGRMWFETKENTGTTFFVNLPKA